MAADRARTATTSNQNVLFLRWAERLQRHGGDHGGVIGEIRGLLREVSQIQKPPVREELEFALSRCRLIREADWELKT